MLLSASLNTLAAAGKRSPFLTTGGLFPATIRIIGATCVQDALQQVSYSPVVSLQNRSGHRTLAYEASPILSRSPNLNDPERSGVNDSDPCRFNLTSPFPKNVASSKPGG